MRIRARRWFGATAVLIALTATAAAQAPRTDAVPPAEATRAYDIPAQPLTRALTAFARAANVRLAYAAALTKGRKAPPLKGAFTRAAALDRLLAGTGLVHRIDDNGAVTLLEASAADFLAQAGATQLEEIVVEGAKARESGRPPPTGTIGQPPEPFAGGQVASGGRMGFLGNRSIFDTPFTQNNYTAQLIRDQQVFTVAEVLDNDPSIRQAASPFNFQNSVYNRGLLLNSHDIAFDGLYGIASFYRPAIEGVERVEVLNGPGAFLYGFPPSGSAGGVINLVPKRATDAPITRVTGQYLSAASGGGTFDVGRRFGDANSLGVRVNGAFRDGATPIDRQRELNGVFTTGIDYRGDRLRLSLDLGYQKLVDIASSSYIRVLPDIAIPKAPPLTLNVQQPWERARTDQYFAAGRAEYDLSKDVTLFGAIGGSSLDNSFLTTTGVITDSQGTYSQALSYATPYSEVQWTGEIGVRARFETGPIHHAASIVGSHYDDFQPNGFVFAPASATNNIYAPIVLPRPDVDIDTRVPLPLLHNQLDSGAVTDTLSVLNDRVQVIAGGRYQRVQSYSFDAAGVPLVSSDKSKPTPLAALIVKPVERLSLYASYAEGFGFGPRPPATAANPNAVFPPVVTTQIETGAKLDLGKVGVTLAFYELEQPSGFLDPVTNVFGVDGRQRNRGIDLNVFGSPIEGVRVLGGATFLDGRLVKTAGGIYDGKVAPGVPDAQVNMGGELDSPAWLLRGLTLSGRVLYTTTQYYDQANTQSIPDWARLDLGARYRFKADTAYWTARFNVENVTGNNYWASTGQRALALGLPRYFRFSLSAEL